MKLATWVVVIAALVGLVLSSLSLVEHYRKDDSEFCNINETFNCDYVNRSEYSQLGPVPVAGIGLAGYVFLLVLARFRSRSVAWFRLFAAAGGLSFALYLTYLEKYVLAVWCILCLGSLAMISLITMASAGLVFQRPKPAGEHSEP